MNVFRGAITSDFWITGLAIVRYVPRAFRVKQIDGDLFFTEEKRQEYRRRVESVTPDSPRQWGTMEVDQMLHHLSLACGGSRGFYDLAVDIEAEDIDAGSFLTEQVQVSRVHKSEIAVDGDAFHLAGNAPGLLDVAHDTVEPIRKKRIVLDIWPRHETRKQISLALVEDLIEDNVQRLSDVISCHKSAFEVSPLVFG